LTVREFYGTYINQLTELRTNLAGITITPKFSNYYNHLNQIISDGIKYFNYGQSEKLQVYEIRVKSSDWESANDTYLDYLTKSLFNDSYYELFIKIYKRKAGKAKEKYDEAKTQHDKILEDYGNHCLYLFKTAYSLNNLGSELSFIDTLNIQIILIGGTEIYDYFIENSLVDSLLQMTDSL